MKIVAIAMAKNEADVVAEGVCEGLRWADEFVIYDNGSTDGTPERAERAGAIVLRGPVGELFNEGLRQHTLEVAGDLGADWVWRIDVDEIYHYVPNPRQVFEEAQEAGASCIRALQMEFWITLDDVRRGLLLEDEGVSVQKRRRWYTCGHMAMVAWRNRSDLIYSSDAGLQKRRNVPITAEGRDVSALGSCHGVALVQKHYNCRGLHQLMVRMMDRVRDLKTFGKYRYNLIIDERIGLHYLGPDEVFRFQDNHHLVYEWYQEGSRLFDQRMELFG